LDAELYDSNGCFNATGGTVTLNGLTAPAYSFVPNVAGFYQFNIAVRFSSSTVSAGSNLQIWKNGSQLHRIFEQPVNSGTYGPISFPSACYLNGTGDYVQMYGQIVGPSPAFDSIAPPLFCTVFTGGMI
jgi:hypothetical protein